MREVIPIRVIKRKVIKNMCFFYVILFLFVLIPAEFASAAERSPQQLKITSVYVNFVEETIVINGKNFKNGHFPNICLGNETLSVFDNYTDNLIEAILPLDYEDGDYLLAIATGPAVKHYDDYALTIGAVGPQGEKGDNGDIGPQGPEGPPGDDCGIIVDTLNYNLVQGAGANLLSLCPDNSHLIGGSCWFDKDPENNNTQVNYDGPLYGEETWKCVVLNYNGDEDILVRITSICKENE